MFNLAACPTSPRPTSTWPSWKHSPTTPSALAKTPDAFSSGIRDRLKMGGRISRDEYVKAQADRAPMRAAVDAALSSCDALALPTCAGTRAEDWRDDGDDRIGGRAAQADLTETDPAVQPDRSPCDFASVWRYAGRPALRAATGRATESDRRAGGRRAQVRGVCDDTCTFIFRSPVNIESIRLTTLTMRPPRNAAQKPST